MSGIIGRYRTRLRRAAGHARHLVPYWLAVARRAPRQDQIRFLPRRITSRVSWIRLEDISLATDVRSWRRKSDGFAIGGDWDRERTAPRPTIFQPAQGDTPKAMTHNAIRSLFLDGESYQQTHQYQYMIDAVNEGSPELAYGCRSEEEVDNYFQTLVSAFQSIHNDGYLTQTELGGDPYDEIKLYITRDGLWCHGNGGNHRIRIAEILGLKWVPFVPAGAHGDWVANLCSELERPPRAAILNWLEESEEEGRLRRTSPPMQGKSSPTWVIDRMVLNRDQER